MSSLDEPQGPAARLTVPAAGTPVAVRHMCSGCLWAVPEMCQHHILSWKLHVLLWDEATCGREAN